MILYLDDHHCRLNLLPLSAVRHVAHIRAGILTILEKWQQLLINSEYDITLLHQEGALAIPAHIIPDAANFDEITHYYQHHSVTEIPAHFNTIHFPWDVYRKNDAFIRSDFSFITSGRRSVYPEAHNIYFNKENIFIEDSARVQGAILNATHGPIYIGPNAEIMEGVCIRGPFALGEGAVVKMGARIYGATTIGPHSVAGGEIKNSILSGYCNKAHDGYLGDSIIGYWCNLGAGTSNSNVKNTGGIISYQSDVDGTKVDAGNKAGLIMGDYSRSAIQTAFNTGTVVGVCCNVFGSGFPSVYMNHFTWGNELYKWDKAMTDINNWKQMKGQELTEDEKNKLHQLYQNLNDHA